MGLYTDVLKRRNMNQSIKAVWVGRSRATAKSKEKYYDRKYGDALMSRGPVILKGKSVPGYAVHVPSSLMRRKQPKRKSPRRTSNPFATNFGSLRI